MTAHPTYYEIVIWEDPVSDFDGWQDISNLAAKKGELVHSIGFPVREDEHHLFLAMDFHDDSCNTLGRIPITAIKARRRVRYRSPKQAQKEPQPEMNSEANGAG